MKPCVAMDVDDQHVQQNREFTLSFMPIRQPALIPLPADFWETSETWMHAATELANSYPDIQDLEFLDQVVDRLGEIVHTIDEAIGSLDLGDALLPEVSSLLFNQCNILFIRYTLGNPDDFLRALHLLDVLPQLCDPTDAKFSRGISNGLENLLSLATMRFLDSRHRSKSRLTQLIESCGGPSDFMTQAESIVEQAHSISHIPTEVGACNHQSPIILDIDSVIDTVDNAIEECDPSNHNLEAIGKLLCVQAMALQARFQLLGDIADLNRAVSMSEVAPKFHSFASDQSSVDLKELAFTPFDELPNRPEFNTKIAIGQELLRHSHEETRIQISMKLAALLGIRSVELGSIADDEEALQLVDDILPFVTGGNRPALLGNQATCIRHLSSLGKQFPDLHQCLQVFDEELAFPSSVPTSHKRVLEASFLWHQLGNVAVAGNKEAAVSAFHEIEARDCLHFEGAKDILRRYSEFDITNVIYTLTEMCAIHLREEAYRPFAMVLVTAFFQRYKLSDDTRYIQDALSVRSQLGPPGSYGFDLALYGGAMMEHSGVEQRSEVTKTMAASSRGMITQYPEISGWRDRPGQREESRDWVGNLNKAFASSTPKYNSEDALKETRESAYERNGDDWSFQVSHRELLLQLSAPKNDPDRHLRALFNLGELYRERYRRQNDIKDLEHALDWYQQAINVSGEDNETFFAWFAKTKWADTLFEIHEATSSGEYPLLLRVHDYYRQAATSICNSFQSRLVCLFDWIRHFRILQNDGQEHFLEVCELALSLLEEQSWAASSLRLSINTRHEWKELGNVIVVLAFGVGIDSGITKAIELMEASQGLVWGRLHRLRAPLGELETVSSELASRFRQLSGLLESRMGLTNAECTFKEDGGGLFTNNLQLNHDMNDVIKEIRTLPGFETFLRRGSFGEDELREVAKEGPVVILMDGGGAIVLQQDHWAFLKLPISLDGLRKLHKHFRSMANSRDTHDAPDLAEGPACADKYPSVGPSNLARGSRAGVQVKRKALVVDSLLEVLWTQVVEPILDQIFGGDRKREGKSRMWEIPKLEDRQRIWWCCHGEFSFLPIHAAGIYGGSSPICLSDFFISSYTPTLTALLDARARSIPPEVKILAAAQPNPGGRWKSLAKVKDELREIVQLTPATNLICLGDADSDQPDFEGHQTSVENVLKRLPEASVLHLACHGTQNEKDPLSSGFILADAKKLTIEELMKYRLPNAHTAILSACHTASNDAEQPYEAINISSALMFLGFSNILGTKWPMNDNDGPVIAKAVYQALFDTTPEPDSMGVGPEEPADIEGAPHNKEQRPTLASFSLAKVVDSVARQLRLKEVPAKRWATFVHVGI